jgi:HECT-domain (ubiquitin-transferase)
MGVSPADFRAVGVILGLGIFNGVILDVHLPLVAYKKLLDGAPTFADLADAQPSLAKGLQALLDYDGDDVADVFCRTFEVEYRLFDTVRAVRAARAAQAPVRWRDCL